jgi:hypothetical protein
MAKSFAAETVNRLVLEGLLSFYAGGTIEIQKNLIARYL